MQKLTLLGVLAILCLKGIGQSTEIKPLTIGDTVPDIVFNHVLNYKDSTARLSDFKGKLLILDFWSSWCGPCIRSMPRFDSLQKMFDGRLQIVMVTRDSPARLSEFLHTNKLAAGVSIPFFAEDSLILSLFPHKTIPHEIWIDSDQKIKAITGSKEVTKENVVAYLQGMPLHFTIKYD